MTQKLALVPTDTPTSISKPPIAQQPLMQSAPKQTKDIHQKKSKLTNLYLAYPPILTIVSNRYKALTDTTSTYNFLKDEVTPYHTDITPATGPEVQVTK